MKTEYSPMIRTRIEGNVVTLNFTKNKKGRFFYLIIEEALRTFFTDRYVASGDNWIEITLEEFYKEELEFKSGKRK